MRASGKARPERPQLCTAHPALAGEALRLFMGDGCPLPRAAHSFEHYEAATDGDTLMMALLALWAARQKPVVELPLTYSDR